MIVDSSSSLRLERRSVPSCKKKLASHPLQSQYHLLSSWSTSSPSCPTVRVCQVNSQLVSNFPHLGVPQQLHHPSLICRESSNLSNHRSHKFSLGRLHTLALAGADSFRDGRSGVPFVGPVAKVYNYAHQHILKTKRVVTHWSEPFSSKS